MRPKEKFPMIGERRAAVITEVLHKSKPSNDGYPYGYQPYRVTPPLDGKRDDVVFDFFCKRTYEPGAVLIFELKADPFFPHSHDWQPVEEDES